jgi:hypothetical protein
MPKKKKNQQNPWEKLKLISWEKFTLDENLS